MFCLLHCILTGKCTLALQDSPKSDPVVHDPCSRLFEQFGLHRSWKHKGSRWLDLKHKICSLVRTSHKSNQTVEWLKWPANRTKLGLAETMFDILSHLRRAQIVKILQYLKLQYIDRQVAWIIYKFVNLRFKETDRKILFFYIYGIRLLLYVQIPSKK